MGQTKEKSGRNPAPRTLAQAIPSPPCLGCTNNARCAVQAQACPDFHWFVHEGRVVRRDRDATRARFLQIFTEE